MSKNNKKIIEELQYRIRNLMLQNELLQNEVKAYEKYIAIEALRKAQEK